MIAILAGVPEELAEIRRRLETPREVRLPEARAWRGRLGDAEVVVAVAGDGAARAERVAEALLTAVPCMGLLGVGVAGGLTEHFRVDDLVVAERVIDAHGIERVPERSWVAAAARRGALPAAVVIASELAATAVDKARLAERSAGAPAVCDLESSVWADAAIARGLPWAVLRVVSDAWDEDLPEFLVRSTRADGSVARGRVAVRAVAIPSRIPALLRLAGRVRRAAVRLADGAAAIMEAASSAGDKGLAREAS